jgi:voltage-gated potassium channel
VKNRLREWRFLQLALCLAALFIILPWASHHLVFQIAVQLFLLNSLLVTIAEEGRKSRLRPYLWSVWAFSIVTSALTWLPGFEALRSAELVLFGALLGGCVFGILRYVFRSARVTIDSIFGAVAAYLLLAAMFAVIDILILLNDPKSFRFPDAAVAGLDVVRSDLLYFSLVTIVTLGYGDIVPVTPLARMVAAFEGVVGQFYVAAVVAMLVGRFIAQALEGGGGPPKPSAR